MAIEKKIGEKLKLTLQLHDGLDTMPNRVFVNLVDCENNNIKSDIELPHLGGGFFFESTELMPNVDTLFAKFRVLKSDGLTQSVDHSDEVDRYEKLIPVEIPSSIVPKPFAVTARVSSVRAKVSITKLSIIKVTVRESKQD